MSQLWEGAAPEIQTPVAVFTLLEQISHICTYPTALLGKGAEPRLARAGPQLQVVHVLVPR